MTTADLGSIATRLADGDTELPNPAKPERGVERQESAEWAIRLPANDKTPTAEQVADVLTGISAIGQACNALTRAGWRASIAGNRITVNDEVLAHFIGAGIDAVGGVEARWVVYETAGVPPVWVVGSQRQP